MPDTSRAAGAARRAEILDAATLAFAARGFRGASLATIAADVGLTQAGLLHHFGSKELLLLAVLQQRERADFAHVQQHVAGRPLAEALAALVARNAAQEGLVRLFVTLQAESIEPGHPAHAWFAQRYRHLRELTAAGVRAEQDAGRLRADLDPDGVAVELLALLDGLQVQWLLDPARVDMVARLRQVLERLQVPVPVPVPAADPPAG